MKICILNGNPTTENPGFDEAVSELENGLKSTGHLTETFLLRDLCIRYCEGCYNCWEKTPGKCFFSDDTAYIRASYISSEFVIMASPIINGFTSHILKKAIDKLIPLLHQHFNMNDQEHGSKGRYVVSPRMGLFVEKSVDTDEDDMNLIREIYCRNAISLKSSVKFVLTTNESVERIIKEINCC